MSYSRLYEYGLSSRFEQEALLHPDLRLARVISQHRSSYIVVTEEEQHQAVVSGRFSYIADDSSSFPVVGDWVMIDLSCDDTDTLIIHECLQRKSVFERKAAGTSGSVQIVASNIDVIFICMSLNNDFNLRRLERYLSIAWQSNATPVVVLTKTDLCEDLADKFAEVMTIAIGVDVLTTSIQERSISEKFSPYLGQEKTFVFIGSSGVGKSSLINCLMGRNVLATQEISNDDSGRHTTTSRQLFLLPTGGVVIDTPGMRELQLDSGNLSKTFDDIEVLASRCKFRNCRHGAERGCAVQQAIADGILSEKRLESYRKLGKEIQYEGLSAWQIEHAKIDKMFGSKREFKEMRKQAKNKHR